MASELFPEPDGPLQTVILWRGMSTSIPFRLCCRAPRTEMASRPSSELAFRWAAVRRPALPLPELRCRAHAAIAIGMKGSVARPAPVWLSLISAICFGRALGDDPAAVLAPFGAQVEDPVGRLHHVEVVLDDDDRVPLVLEPVQHLQQLLDVVEVQAGGGLVEDVQRLARCSS